MFRKPTHPRAILPDAGLLTLVIAAVLTAWPPALQAQRANSFKANGRDIPIDAFNREVTQMMRDLGVPGMSLAVIENDQVVFYNGYGLRQHGDDKTVDQKTVFDGCSLSKSLLAFVALQLAGEGTLDLDKPMYKYLAHERLQYDARYKKITARMILSHASGIENWEHYNTPDTLEIMSTPGEKYIYSGEGYEYLADAIEGILHQSYEEYVSERVIKPLGLKNTYLKYKEKGINPFGKGRPSNYATGHDVVGQQQVFKNYETFPAAGNHFTAEDYARIILAIFDPARGGAAGKREILQPMVGIRTSAIGHGLGFEVLIGGGDTIISHGGDKPGYKNLMFYSVAKKRGFVFMTNSDLGKAMSARLNELSVGLHVEPWFDPRYYHLDQQYPSAALSLLKLCRGKAYGSMFAALERLKQEQKPDATTLNVVSGFLLGYGGDAKIAKTLLKENVALYPDSALSYTLLGEVYYNLAEYDLAYTHFKKAKALHFSLWEIEKDIAQCEKQLAEIEQRKSFLTTLNGNVETLLEAERYNAMQGVKLQPTSDAEGVQHVGYIDDDDWMEYKVHIPAAGTYAVAVRVASLEGGSHVQFRLGKQVLSTVDVTATHGWDQWETFSTRVELPAGDHTLKVYAATGGFSINWIRFSATAAKPVGIR